MAANRAKAHADASQQEEKYEVGVEVVLCFVSLQVDLPTVWHGLGR